jgi:hypothetical protein
MRVVHSMFSPQVCPHCAGLNTRRSLREGLFEFLLHWVLFLSPYRCRDCYQRYFGFRFAQPPSAPVTTLSK